MDKETKIKVLEIAKIEYDKDVYDEIKQEVKLDMTQSAQALEREELETGEEVELGSEKNSLDFSFFTEHLLNTNHLDNYTAMDLDLGLVGNSYKPLKKALWYFHNSLKQETKSYKINRKTKIDNRKHMLVLTSAAAGKTTMKNQIKHIAGTNDVYETTGLSHPEQLVGTTRHVGKGENKEVKKIPGILSFKVVLNDEAQTMLNEENEMNAKSQRIKRISMDTFEENEISKKLVEDSKDEILKYFPECRIFDFAHPQKLSSPFFDTGSFRRYDIFNLEYNPVIDLNDVTDFQLETKEESDMEYDKTLNDFYARKRIDVQFTQDTLNIISHYHKCLLFYLLKHKNKNAFRYGLLTRYAMRISFCKNVFILAIAKNQKIPTDETVIEACCDTMLFIFKSIEAINDLGDMGISSDVWGGLKEQDAEACEFLLRNGAVSLDKSDITIKKFWSVLANLYGLSMRQARAHFYRLKREGFVDGKRVGKSSSAVWLKYKPKDIIIDAKDFNQLGLWEKQFTSDGVKTPVLSVVRQLFTDDKSFQEATSDGSVGVWGCVFNKIKKINNKLVRVHVREYPPTMSLASVVDNQNSLSTIKPQITTDKTPKTQPSLVKPKPQTDRKVQFYEAPECESIKPNHTKQEILDFIKSNPGTTYKELYDNFGVGCINFKNELVAEGLVQVLSGKLSTDGGSNDS